MLDFKKHQKKFMAFFGVFLMIAFALPSAVSNMQNRREVTIGFAGQDKVTNKDLAQAKQELDNLHYIQRPYRDPRDPSAMPQAIPVLDYYLGAAKSREFQNNPELYFLLEREADRMGITVQQDMVREILANRVPGAAQLTDAELAPPLENLLKVVTAARRAAGGLQTTSPKVLDELSKYQALSLNVVEFKAQDYLSKVPPYSDAERKQKLAEQYKRYKDVLPTTRPANEKTGEPQNDFAFGYRVPNQVQVQYIEVPRDAVVRLVKGKITEVDAIKYYMENKETKYPTTKPAEPVTFKAAPPPPTVAAMTAASQPATQAAVPKVFTETVQVTQMTRVNAPPMAFKDYKQKVYDDLTNERAGGLSNDILGDINSTLAADYAEFKKSPAAQAITSAATTLPTTAPTTAKAVASSSLGVPYESYEYFQKLALHEQEKYQLLPTVGYDAGLRTEQQLQSSPLGQAVLPEYGAIISALAQQSRDFNQILATAHIATFPGYATSLIEPLVTPTVNQLARVFRLRALALYEPSAMLQSGSFASQPPSGGLFVFRAIQAVPAHAAPEADVTEQLLADARMRDAYELARKDAEKLVANAKKSGRLTSAAEAAGKKVISTGMLDMRMPPDFGGLKIDDRTTQSVFINSSYGLLTATQDGPDRQHPIGVIDLKPVTSVFAGQVNELKPIWTPSTLTAFERVVKVEQDQAAVASSQSVWLSADDIVRRMQYKELSPSKKGQQPAPQPADEQPTDQNPFR